MRRALGSRPVTTSESRNARNRGEHMKLGKWIATPGLVFVGAWNVGGCGGTDARVGEPRASESAAPEPPAPSAGLQVRPVTQETFVLDGASSEDCRLELETDLQKLNPRREELEDTLGGASEAFVVLMKEEIDPARYPFPADTVRADGAFLEADPRYMARAARIGSSQACAVLDVETLGGRYVESFVLINAFVAEMTAAQAHRISQRTDVRSVELSQTDAPPP